MPYEAVADWSVLFLLYFLSLKHFVSYEIRIKYKTTQPKTNLLVILVLGYNTANHDETNLSSHAYLSNQ